MGCNCKKRKTIPKDNEKKSNRYTYMTPAQLEQQKQEEEKLKKELEESEKEKKED
jgi:hypothetical protein